MTKLQTKNDYIKYFKETLDKAKSERIELKTYLNIEFQKLDKLIESISPENFWQVFPEILGVDAKLMLLTELMSYDDLSNEDIIRIVENDYQNYFKDLCLYDLKMKGKPSIIFHVI